MTTCEDPARGMWDQACGSFCQLLESPGLWLILPGFWISPLAAQSNQQQCTGHATAVATKAAQLNA